MLLKNHLLLKHIVHHIALGILSGANISKGNNCYIKLLPFPLISPIEVVRQVGNACM